MTSTDDHDLIRGLKANDESYFSIFIERYAGFLIAAAKYQGLSYVDAKIAADEAIYKVIKNIQQFDTSKSKNLKAWIYKIAKRCALDILREKEKQFPFQSSEEQEEKGFQATEDICQGTDCPPSKQNLLATEILNKALHCLSPTDQIVLTEKSYGLTHKEIGEQLNKTEGAVKTAYHRALAKLKNQYINLLDSMEEEEIKLVLKTYLYEKPSEKAAN